MFVVLHTYASPIDRGRLMFPLHHSKALRRTIMCYLLLHNVCLVLRSIYLYLIHLKVKHFLNGNATYCQY